MSSHKRHAAEQLNNQLNTDRMNLGISWHQNDSTVTVLGNPNNHNAPSSMAPKQSQPKNVKY